MVSNPLYKFFTIPNYQIIADKTYDYIRNHTNTYQRKVFWSDFKNIQEYLDFVPELRDWFKNQNLVPDRISPIYVEPNLIGNVHVDGDCRVRFILPVYNCSKFTLKFFNIPDEHLIEKIESGSGQTYFDITTPPPYEQIGEVAGFTSPFAFHSRVAHSANYNDTDQCALITIGFTTPINQYLSI